MESPEDFCAVLAAYERWWQGGGVQWIDGPGYEPGPTEGLIAAARTMMAVAIRNSDDAQEWATAIGDLRAAIETADRERSAGITQKKTSPPA